MAALRLQTFVSNDGTLTIKGLPAFAGKRVEVIVRDHAPGKKTTKLYPLRGTPVEYRDPYEGVAEDDWDALR